MDEGDLEEVEDAVGGADAVRLEEAAALVDEGGAEGLDKL